MAPAWALGVALLLWTCSAVTPDAVGGPAQRFASGSEGIATTKPAGWYTGPVPETLQNFDRFRLPDERQTEAIRRGVHPLVCFTPCLPTG